MTLASIIAAMTAAGCTAEQIGSVVQSLSSGNPTVRKPRTLDQPILEILKTVLTTQSAQAVIDHRKAKKAPLTPRAAELLVTAFRATGVPETAADTMIANGWQGFRPEWFHNFKSTNGHGRSNGNEGFVKSVLEDIENDKRRQRDFARSIKKSSAQNVPMLLRDRDRH